MYYLFTLILLFAAELFYFVLAKKYNILDRPNQRSSHNRITLRGGGIVFYLGALVYFLFSGFEYPWFTLGLSGIALISFRDDIRPVSRSIRLTVHFTAMLLLFYQTGMFIVPLWYIPIALVICTGIINAYNFMDGINGITGGYSLIVLSALLYINQCRINFIETEFIGTLIVAVLVFDFFNFRKNARCFAGDVGSVSIAFIIIFLLSKLILITQDASYLILLAVYGVDSSLTILHRLLLHENIGLPHRKHLYQIMANELKIPHLSVAALYMLLQGIIFIGYMICFEVRYLYFAGTVLFLAAGYYFFMKKYFHLHMQKQAACK